MSRTHNTSGLYQSDLGNSSPCDEKKVKKKYGAGTTTSLCMVGTLDPNKAVHVATQPRKERVEADSWRGNGGIGSFKSVSMGSPLKPAVRQYGRSGGQTQKERLVGSTESAQRITSVSHSVNKKVRTVVTHCLTAFARLSLPPSAPLAASVGTGCHRRFTEWF